MTIVRLRLLYGLFAGSGGARARDAGRARPIADERLRRLCGRRRRVLRRGDGSAVLLYHLAELDLYLGVLPFAAFALLTLTARRLEPALAPFLAAGLALTASVLLVVAAFASRLRQPDPGAEHLRRRAVLSDRAPRLGRPWRVLGSHASSRSGTVIACALLPLAIPWERFIETGATSDTLALLPIWSAFGSLLFDSIDWMSLPAAPWPPSCCCWSDRAGCGVLPAVTLLFLLTFSYNVWTGEHGFRQASTGAISRGCAGRATGSTVPCPPGSRPRSCGQASPIDSR